MTVLYGQVNISSSLQCSMPMSSQPYGTVKDLDEGEVKPSCRDSRRKAMVDTARDVFLKEGFAAASMSAIAARVGGSKGTLYNYFDSKEALFVAVIEDHCERAMAAIFNFDPEVEDFAAALRTLSERYVKLILSEQVIALNRLVVAEAIRFPEIGRIMYEAGPRRGVRRLTAYIEAAVRDGHLRACDPAVAAEQLMDLCLAGRYRLRLLNVAPPPSAAEVATAVDAAMTTFMAAFGADAR